MIFRQGNARKHLESYARDKGLEKLTYVVFDLEVNQRDDMTARNYVADFFKNGVPDWMEDTIAYDISMKTPALSHYNCVYFCAVADIINAVKNYPEGMVVVDMAGWKITIAMDIDTASKFGDIPEYAQTKNLKVGEKVESTLDFFNNTVEPGDIVSIGNVAGIYKVQFVSEDSVYTVMGRTSKSQVTLLKSANNNPIYYGYSSVHL